MCTYCVLNSFKVQLFQYQASEDNPNSLKPQHAKRNKHEKHPTFPYNLATINNPLFMRMVNVQYKTLHAVFGALTLKSLLAIS